MDREKLSDWIMPAILLIPHFILLLAIFLEEYHQGITSSILPTLLGCLADIATILAFIIALFALSSWRKSIISSEILAFEKRVLSFSDRIQIQTDSIILPLFSRLCHMNIDIKESGQAWCIDTFYYEAEISEFQTRMLSLADASQELISDISHMHPSYKTKLLPFIPHISEIHDNIISLLTLLKSFDGRLFRDISSQSFPLNETELNSLRQQMNAYRKKIEDSATRVRSSIEAMWA